MIYNLEHTFDVKPDYLFVIDVSVEESLKRRYSMGGNIVLSNENFLSFYKKELNAFNKTVRTPIWYLDTTHLSICSSTNIAYEKIIEIIK